MNQDLNKPQAFSEQLAKLKALAEKENVMTPEVEHYMREENEKFQAKIVAKQPITKADVAFMEEVRQWMEMPEWWRGKNSKVEDAKAEWEGFPDEAKEEAEKRGILPRQWQDLIHISKTFLPEREPGWIDRCFQFPGNKKIIAEKLDLNRNFNLERLPEGLEVTKDLALSHCKTATLPSSLKIGGNLFLDCSAISELPKHLNRIVGNLNLSQCENLTRLYEGLVVGQTLDLDYCKALPSLPENMKIGRDLRLIGCTKIKYLPNNILIEGDLYLTSKPSETIKRDLIRLKRNGKIKGKIYYVSE